MTHVRLASAPDEASGPNPRSMAQAPNLTARATAVRLGVSVGTLANWRSARVGPSYLKIGSRVMYPVSEIEQFEQHCLVATVRLT